MRVGFVMPYTDTRWLGGVNYLSNLVTCLQLVPSPEIEPVVICAPAAPRELLRRFPSNVEILRTSLVYEGGWPYRVRKLVGRLAERDIAMETFLRFHRIDALSHSGHLGLRARIPTLGWIPDFQHRALPHFFSEKEIRGRDRTFKRLCRNCSAVIVSSESARYDLLAFEPSAASKAHILRFATGKTDVSNLPSLDELSSRYNFAGRYFHLPNQFWLHKNHEVVIRALAELKRAGENVIVISTGSTSDTRAPGHYERLAHLAKELEVDNSFRILGIVPYNEMVALMYHSQALINPSLFEGWSTTVEEAKSLGKCAILSDIAVHREQAPNRAIYFDPRDACGLANAMRGVLANCTMPNELEYAVSAAKSAENRTIAFGQQFIQIVRAAIS